MNNETDNALGLRRIQMIEHRPIKDNGDLVVAIILLGAAFVILGFGVWMNL